MRYRGFFSVLVAMGVMAAMGSQAMGLAGTKPNIIMIIVDDAGPGDFTSFHASSPVSTPNIDALAANGMKYTQAYSGAPVCAPARSALMSGYHLGHATLRGNGGGTHIFDNVRTMPELLQKAGYTTGGYGKWGNGNVGTTGAAERQGFDEFVGYYHQVHAHDHYTNRIFDTGVQVNLPENNNVSVPASKLVNPQHTHTFNLYTERMRDFIGEQAQSGEPFFAYGPWTPPHLDNEIPADEPLYQQYANVPGWNTSTKIQATFMSMIDREVGRIVDLVNDPNGDGNQSDSIADNTLILFMSDNGGSTNSVQYDRNPGLRGQKGTMWEGGLRVPLIAAWAGKIAPGSTSDVQTYFPDFLPTLTELAGTDNLAPDNIDGRSLVPSFTGDNTEIHDHLYFEDTTFNFGGGIESNNLRRAVRMGDWKAVMNGPSAAIQLFDLSTDPDESNNVAAANPAIVAQMQAIMDAEHTDARAQFETGHSGQITPNAIRPGVLTLGPISNASFEDPALEPTDPNQGKFQNGGITDWSGGFIHDVANTDAANGNNMFQPNEDWTGEQVGGMNTSGSTSSLSQVLKNDDDTDMAFHLDDLERIWTVELSMGRRNGQGGSNLLIDIVGQSGAIYFTTSYDIGQLAQGEWTRELLTLDLNLNPVSQANVRNDLGDPLSLRFRNGGGGQAFLDDVVLLVTEWGDLDRDGLSDAGDIDHLFSELLLPAGTRDLFVDLDLDGDVDDVDTEILIHDILDTEFGDANLDQKVSLLDLNALGMNFGQSGGWSESDFNGDGTVSLLDLNLLGAHFGFDFNATPPDPPDPPIFSPQTPEPSSFALMALALSATARRRERRGRG